MENKHDVLVFCGRFQPFHNGHKAVIDRALEMAKEVVVVVGSSFQARSTKNPFTFEERKAMIDAVYGEQFNYAGSQGRIKTPRVKVVPVMDYPYDDNAWVSAVQNAVNGAISSTWSDFPKKIGLIGHSKDSSSYYLKIFPQWRNHIEVENIDGINATDIRDKILDYKGTTTYLYQVMPKKAVNYLECLVYADEYGNMQNGFDELATEYSQIMEYRKSWASAPYEPTFVTTDAVLTQSGHILLIKRGGFPFKNCWALPGGYLAKGQFIADNMIKELREETCVKVPEKVLRGSIKDVQIFDHPDRDPRGRTITHGFHIDLGFPNEKLPRVKGSDDAIHAEWVPLGELKREMFAFDHWHIIQRFIPNY
jgi:bifunctional NMN adenylyltransferase/nudix hydrolase